MEAPFASCAPLSLSLYPCRGEGTGTTPSHSETETVGVRAGGLSHIRIDGLLVGVDTGGTFTDFVLLEERSGQVFNFKLPSTPKDPGGALVEGLGGRALAERRFFRRWFFAFCDELLCAPHAASA